ncbi:kelch-like protein 11 [Oculina patagonica]
MDSILEPITETEEHKFCVKMMKRLDIQRRNEQFCDVILEVGSGDDQARLKAHRVVLCAASPFFFNALNSDMKEKKEGVIRLEETSKAVMEEVLEYLYTGHVDINEHNAFDLLAAADYFFVSSLKTLCSKVILQTMSFSNCIAAYYFAVKYQCEELQKGASDFILANFVAVAETEDFLNLSSKQVQEWISSDEIIVKGEDEVFEVLVKWINRNESQKQSFYDWFRHIRCIYVPRDYLVNDILPNPFVKNSRDCSNLASDAMKMVFTGQEACFFAQSSTNCLKTHEDAFVACGGKNTLCYIPSENEWYKMADMLSTISMRYSGQAISSCHGMLFRIGGNPNGYSAERYYPSVNTWFPLKSFQETINLCSVVTFQGLLYIIGGVDEHNNRLSTVQRYNPDTNVWQAMPSLSTPRSSVCAVADEKHLYAIGGNSPSGLVDVAEIFDPKERVWRRIASTQEKRVGAGGAAMNHKVFVFGGVKREGYSGSCEMYDPVTDIWSNIAKYKTLSSTGKYMFLSTVCFKGKIFVCGEFQTDDSQGNMSLQVYDTVSNEWTSCTSFCLGLENFKISSLRIPREILDACEVLS